MLILYLKAPFGAYRPFVAGSYRQTSPFITPTGAYGLLLNLAGIESRLHDPKLVATAMRDDLPSAKVVIGMLREPTTSRLLQQLHNYPVGEHDKRWTEPKKRTHGSKYNIQPITRELLNGIEGYIGLDGNDDLEDSVRRGLARGLSMLRTDGRPRYGIPFLGDNSLMVDVIEEVAGDHQPMQPARWYCPLSKLPQSDGPRPGTCRMTTWIDRNNMSRTRSDLFAPSDAALSIPEEAWVEVGPSL